MALDPGGYERAERYSVEATLTYVIKGIAGEGCAEAMTFESGVDFGMGEDHPTVPQAVLGKTGGFTVDADLVPPLVCIVLNLYVHIHSSMPLVRCKFSVGDRIGVFAQVRSGFEVDELRLELLE